MRKQERKYFRLQIRLLLSVFCLFLPIFVGFQLYSDPLQKFSQNIIYLHVPSAWTSVILYTYVLYSHILHKFAYKEYVYGSVFCIHIVVISGTIWGKLIFGEFVIFDVKLLPYYLLLLTIVSIFYVKGTYKVIILATGLLFYIQSYLASDWLNTFHQNSFIVVVAESFQNSQLFIEINSLLVVLQTLLILNIMILLVKCFIKPTTII